MQNLKNIPINKNELMDKLNKYALKKDYKVAVLERSNFDELKFLNSETPGIIRLYFTKKGITVDGSTGKNKILNQEIISYINEIISNKHIEEKRINFEKIKNEEFQFIIEKINSLSDTYKKFEIKELKLNNPTEKQRMLVKDINSKEEITLTYYSNNSLYINGFTWDIGEEIINIISRIKNKKNLSKINYLNELIHKCNEEYILDNGGSCIICENKCNGHYGKFLREIHFGDKKRYDCDKIMNYYVSKYSYRYAFEIQNIFKNYLNQINDFNEINILSIGCGPCTELLGFLNLNESYKDQTKYFGIDLNKKWKGIHQIISNQIGSEIVKFYYEDIFEFINKINPYKKEIDFNILIFQYVISDITKYKTKKEIYNFFENFNSQVMEYLPSGAIIVLNDINHQEKARDIFAMLENLLPSKEYEFDKYYFKTKDSNYFKYGEAIAENVVSYSIPNYIENRYNPWITCNSASLVIRKV